MLTSWIAFKTVRLTTKFFDWNISDIATASNSRGNVNNNDNDVVVVYNKSSSAVEQKRQYIWRMYGNEYDATDFIYKHPGGI
jgi:hypothetical protein